MAVLIKYSQAGDLKSQRLRGHGRPDIYRLNPGVEAIGTARDGRQALKQVEMTQPDVLLIDLNMPLLSGLDTIPLVKIACPGLKILTLTLTNPNFYRPLSLLARSDELVTKAKLVSELFPAIQRVTQNSNEVCS